MPLVPLAPYKVPRRSAAAQTAQLFNIPAPVGGLNYRDPISAMQPTDAVCQRLWHVFACGVAWRRVLDV
jgi:hypothetical protein